MAYSTDPVAHEALAAIIKAQQVQLNLTRLLVREKVTDLDIQMAHAKLIGATEASLDMALRRLGYA